MLAIFSGVELKDCIEIQGKKNKAVVLCSSSPQKVNLGIFTSVVYVQWQQRNVQTEHDARAIKVVVLPI